LAEHLQHRVVALVFLLLLVELDVLPWQVAVVSAYHQHQALLAELLVVAPLSLYPAVEAEQRLAVVAFLCLLVSRRVL
jgi:hypothetical protein